MRGRYYMHTGYRAQSQCRASRAMVRSSPTSWPTQVPHLEIPPFVSVGGGSVGPGFLGMAWAPFRGRFQRSGSQPRHGDRPGPAVAAARDARRPSRSRFIGESRGGSPRITAKVLDKTVKLMTSEQMEAFKVEQEPADVQERYGEHRLRPRLPDGPAAGGGRACPSSKSIWAAGTTMPTSSRPWPTEAAGTRPGDERPGGRPGRPRAARRHGRDLDGRVRPHAEHQRQRRPRPLGPQLERRRGRRRLQARHRGGRDQCRRQGGRHRALHVAGSDGQCSPGARHLRWRRPSPPRTAGR